jgi:hypothetical protein
MSKKFAEAPGHIRNNENFFEPESHYVAQASQELMIPLPQPVECGYFRWHCTQLIKVMLMQAQYIFTYLEERPLTSTGTVLHGGEGCI